MGWSHAYHYHLNKPISIIDAMKLRVGKDPRAGDLHCHKKCFESKTGSRLLTRQQSSNGKRAHFARWPGSYTQGSGNCANQVIADSKRESMDYANYYSNFEIFLNGVQRASDPFFIDEVETEDGVLMPDFTIIHSNGNPHGISKTNIHIVDENNRRKKRFVKTSVDEDLVEIVIRISEYTPQQLSDFQRGGIERLHSEWEYVMGLLDKRSRARAYEEARLKKKEEARLKKKEEARLKEKEEARLKKKEEERRKKVAKQNKDREFWHEKCKPREEVLAPIYDAFQQHIMPILEAGKVANLPKAWYWWYFFWENHDQNVKMRLIEWRMGAISDAEFWDSDWFYFDNPNYQFSKSDYSSMADLIAKMSTQAEEINRNPPNIDEARYSQWASDPIASRFHLICFTPYACWEDDRLARFVRKRYSGSI